MVMENKEAVKIDDWVNDIRGSFICWIEATDETPATVNENCYRMVYSPHKDSGASLVYKFVGVVGKILVKLGRKDNFAFEVSETIYPRSAIEGFDGGTTVSGVPREKGTPDKRVILRNDVHGNRPYMSQVGPGSEGIEKTKSELQGRINELEMEIDALEGQAHELEEQVDRDKGGSTRGSGYGPENYDVMRGEGVRSEDDY